MSLNWSMGNIVGEVGEMMEGQVLRGMHTYFKHRSIPRQLLESAHGHNGVSSSEVITVDENERVPAVEAPAAP